MLIYSLSCCPKIVLILNSYKWASYGIAHIGGKIAFKVIQCDRLHGGWQDFLAVLQNDCADVLQEAGHPEVHVMNSLTGPGMYKN
jgi:hypothetical protein